MQSVWPQSPRVYQSTIVSRILHMLSGDIPTQIILTVQCTGSGKSALHQTVSIIHYGVTIVIKPTLSLSSDQSLKIDEANSSDSFSIYCFQLVRIKQPFKQHSIANNIINNQEHTQSSSIIIFTSPESLMLPIWSNLVTSLIKRHLLHLLCIDEVHLFITFGLSFPKLFLNMKTLIFDKLKSNNGDLKAPI